MISWLKFVENFLLLFSWLFLLFFVNYLFFFKIFIFHFWLFYGVKWLHWPEKYIYSSILKFFVFGFYVLSFSGYMKLCIVNRWMTYMVFISYVTFCYLLLDSQVLFPPFFFLGKQADSCHNFCLGESTYAICSFAGNFSHQKQ